MTGTIKRILWAVTVCAILCACTVAILFSYAGASVTSRDAASAEGFGWTPSVRYRTGTSGDTYADFVNVTQPINVPVDTEIGFFFRITDADIVAGSTYQYCTSSEKLHTTDRTETETALRRATWNRVTFTRPDPSEGIDAVNYFEREEDGNTVYYVYLIMQINSGFDGYAYFRRDYTKNVDGSSVNVPEFHTVYISLTYNVTADVDPEITSVIARMGDVPYDGRYVSGALRFQVYTALSQRTGEFDPKSELLSYSVNDGEDFVPVSNPTSTGIDKSYAVVTIKDRSLSGVNVIFRVSDIAGEKTHTWTFGTHEALGEYPVKMDPYSPEFTVSAETTDDAGNRISYGSGTWASRAVSFRIGNVSKCCSTIRYYVSLNGGEYAVISGTTYVVGETLSSLRFRAVNEAGTVFEYVSTFSVNVDTVQPNVSVSATTTDPDNDAARKSLVRTPLPSGGYEFGYANGDIELFVYNRDASGRAIVNTSGVSFQYQEKVNGLYAGNWHDMPTRVTSETGEVGYVVPFSTKDAISVTKTCKFRILSNAGLASEEKEATFTLIKSTYLIGLGEITAEINALGWIADKAVVSVSVPTDSKRMGETFTNPTTSYVFYYAPTNDPTDVRSAIGTRSAFHQETESEVRWWYTFDLVASADSTFQIYAKNAAGKKSGNTEITDEKIRIDVLDPVAELEAYVHATNSEIENKQYLDVSDPAWVNGQISLDLSVRDGVSGVYVKEMIYSIENGEILRDNNGEIVWQPRNQQMTASEELIIDGKKWYVYHIIINLEDELEDGQRAYIGTKEFRYRVYTNSGKYTDVDFSASVDTSDVIALTEFSVTSGNKRSVVDITGNSGQRYVDMLYYDYATWDKDYEKWSLWNDAAKEWDYSYNAEGKGFSVWQSGVFGFRSGIDVVGLKNHYVLSYKYFDGSGLDDSQMLEFASSLERSSFERVSVNDVATKYPFAGKDTQIGIPFTVPANGIGDLYLAVFIESTAIDYEGKVISAGPYVVKLHYDTKTLVIDYSLDVNDGEVNYTEKMEGGDWVKGEVDVTVRVRTDDVGGTKIDSAYTFYYALVSRTTATVAEDDWIKVAGVLNEMGDGSYEYLFTLPFTEKSYSGYLAISVCNAAGYRSEQQAASTTQIMIDNTLPTVDEAVVYAELTGENVIEGVRNEGLPGTSTETLIDVDEDNDGIVDAQVRVISYYSTQEITLVKTTNQGRSDIRYYYLYIGSASSAVTKYRYNFTQMTEVEDRFELFAPGAEYSESYYLLYVRNSVGTEATGATAVTNESATTIVASYIYRFVFDPSELTGTVSFDESNGYYNDGNGMFSYMWKNSANVYVSAAGSKTPTEGKDKNSYVMYQFSPDSGATWYDYLDHGYSTWYASGEDRALLFSPDLFRDYYYVTYDRYGREEYVYPFRYGVNGSFTFRARNKAGTTLTYENVYIAMEDSVPAFKIVVEETSGLDYYGGEADLTKDPVKWSSGPITIKIVTDDEGCVVPASGITFKYYLQYNNGTNLVTTASDGGFGKTLLNYKMFSTDTLDGFNLNNDVVLYITAISNSSEDRYSQQRVRIAVDQVVPEFTLSGHAYSNATSNATSTLISSGEWTNRDTVSVTKAVVRTNVSAVEYRYTVKNKDSTAAESAPTVWPDSIGEIKKSESCTITVTATSASGLTYTKDFVINIDTVAPVIRFDGGINVIDGEEYFIDLRVYVEEANVEICEYITIKGESRGFAFPAKGYILSTSSVDNSTRYETGTGDPYRGYVKVYVKDYAGNEASISFYVLPFRLTVNNLTLTDEDLAQVDAYETMLNKARGYMEENRIAYFENLISRLNDRENTLRKEIAGYQDYLEKLYNRTSFELRSDYKEMFEYMETFHNYELYGQKWIQDAITGDSTSKYYFYYQNFQTQFGKLQALMKAVETAEAHVTALPAINMVERKDYEDILRVYDEYNNLTLDQQACFTSNLYNKLMDLKEDCEVLLLTDEDMGISINGDFAPGATISVTEFSETTETYINAQNTLAKTVSESAPRTIVAIYRVKLDGAYAQTSASDISVQLPIAEEYQDYIYFSVFELSDDGSMKLVTDSEIQPDGKSVKFSTDELKTYVLCVKANMQETETTDGVYGTLLGLELNTKMIRYLIYIGAALFGLVILVVVIAAVRHRRFLNSYNRAYRHSLYRQAVRGVPKGNKIKRK